MWYPELASARWHHDRQLRTLYACLGASVALHALAMLVSPGLRPVAAPADAPALTALFAPVSADPVAPVPTREPRERRESEPLAPPHQPVDPVPTATPTPSLTILATALPAGRVGVFYHASLGLSGGTPPYLVYVSAGALPRGLTLNTFSGEISGTPGVAGASRFRIYVTDRSHESVSRAFQISVIP